MPPARVNADAATASSAAVRSTRLATPLASGAFPSRSAPGHMRFTAFLSRGSLRLERRQPPLVAPPRGELRFAEPPGDIERRFAAALGELAVLTLMVMETAEA